MERSIIHLPLPPIRQAASVTHPVPTRGWSVSALFSFVDLSILSVSKLLFITSFIIYFIFFFPPDIYPGSFLKFVSCATLYYSFSCPAPPPKKSYIDFRYNWQLIRMSLISLLEPSSPHLINFFCLLVGEKSLCPAILTVRLGPTAVEHFDRNFL